MSGFLQALVGVAGTLVVAFIGYLGVRYTAKTQREANEDSRTDKLLASQREDFKAVLDPIRERLDEAEKRIDLLEDEVQQVTRRFRVAIEFIRNLLRWINLQPELSHGAPTVPEELADDI